MYLCKLYFHCEQSEWVRRTAKGSSTGLSHKGPTKIKARKSIIISQFCQIVKECYWNVDRLFQKDQKLPISIIWLKDNLTSNKKMGLCLDIFFTAYGET